VERTTLVPNVPPIPDSDHDLLVDLRATLYAWRQWQQEAQDRTDNGIKELWVAVDDLRVAMTAMKIEQAQSAGHKSGINWLLNMLVAAPGVVAALLWGRSATG
jgi:hypothetical protein